MARYDIFLVSALADKEKAELIVKRLRALKFKVRHDKKREHTSPTPKDYRDADASQSVLVLWSKEACNTDQKDSDWVHALAHHARSKDGVLLQAGLDKTIPDEPFDADSRFSMSGMGPKKLVNGYYDLVDELGRRDGRKDLRDWIDLKPSDKEGKEIWKEAHPTDPLSQVGKPPAKKPTTAPTKKTKPAATASTETRAAVSPETKPTAPPLRTVPKKTAPPASTTPSIEPERIMLGIVGLVIFAMLALSAALPTQSIQEAGPDALSLVVDQCPAGQMPAYLLEQTRPPLEPGPIIDDTE